MTITGISIIGSPYILLKSLLHTCTLH